MATTKLNTFPIPFTITNPFFALFAFVWFVHSSLSSSFSISSCPSLF
ncbi:hypothetical protein CUMW_030210, partial [Citrus unshiu]